MYLYKCSSCPNETLLLTIEHCVLSAGTSLSHCLLPYSEFSFFLSSSYLFLFSIIWIQRAFGLLLSLIVTWYTIYFYQHRNYFKNIYNLSVFCFFKTVGVLGNNTWLVFLPLAPIKTSSAGLLILAFITVMLSVTSLLLLGHLLVFHFYLCEIRSSRLVAILPPHIIVNHHYFPVMFFLLDSQFIKELAHMNM